MITQLHKLPEGLLELNANQLHNKIDDLTLVHLQGKIARPVFISILQHGNEYTGWHAVRDYLKNHQHVLPRSLCILFGNMQAARYNVRQLDKQTDFNRLWPSHLIKHSHPIAKSMQEITDLMQLIQPFASVDIHNNSGRNPHYSGINKLDTEFLNLASLFSDTMLYFTTPAGIQSAAFAQFCPSLTIECGLSGSADGSEQTHTFLELLLSQSNLLQPPGILEHQKVYQTIATVKVKAEIDMGFEQNQHELMLVKDLDFINFKNIKAGEVFAKINPQLMQKKIMPFVVTDQNNTDITAKYFTIKGDSLVTNSDFVPSMISQNISAIQQDCLCYIMQAMPTATL